MRTIQPGILYFVLSAILFAGMGIYLWLIYKPSQSIISPQFFTIFGIVLILLGVTRALKAIKLIKQK
jgi:hypothetical protein